MTHPIIVRYMKALAEARDIAERFENEFGHPPTREECAMAATLYIEANKQESKGKAKDQAKDEGVPSECADCGGDLWDNRAKKASGDYKPKAPDFKCKDCEKPIWLDDRKENKPRERKPISDPDPDGELPF